MWSVASNKLLLHKGRKQPWSFGLFWTGELLMLIRVKNITNLSLMTPTHQSAQKTNKQKKKGSVGSSVFLRASQWTQSNCYEKLKVSLVSTDVSVHEAIKRKPLRKSCGRTWSEKLKRGNRTSLICPVRLNGLKFLQAEMRLRLFSAQGGSDWHTEVKGSQSFHHHGHNN